MARRFSDLEQRLVRALQAGATMDSLQSVSNTDVALRNYVIWKLRKVEANHRRSAASKRQTGGLLAVNINPFDIDLPANTYIKTTVSRRTVNSGVNIAVAAKSRANWQTLGTGAFAMPGKGWFSPAKATVRQAQSTATTVPASSNKITGTEYSTRTTANEQGFVIPFGQAGTKTELEVRKDITDALDGLGANVSYVISFASEDIQAIPDKGAAVA